jgi:Uma2 family endonuclease
MMHAAERILFTEDEYLERERKAEGKSEFVNGEILAMAGGSPRHNAIAMNVAWAVRNQLSGRRCLVFGSDQRIHVPATGLYTYPDVSVTCDGPRFLDSARDTLINPKILVEVLSSSTEAYDRGAKFAHYRSIPSLEEYLLVSQDQKRVEHYRRIEPRQWLLTEYDGEDASVPVLGLDVPLREIYANLDLLEAGIPESGTGQ